MKFYTVLVIAALAAVAALDMVEATTYGSESPPAYPSTPKPKPKPHPSKPKPKPYPSKPKPKPYPGSKPEPKPYPGSKPKSCESGQARCKPDGRIQHCVDGGWKSSDCPSDKVCKPGANKKATCDSKPTPSYPGTNPTAPPTCPADQCRCKGDKQLESCVNGGWVVSDCPSDMVCKPGFSEKTKCVPKSAPAYPGTTPPPAPACQNDQPKCKGDKQVESCVNGNWVVSDCPSDATCEVGTDNKAQCAKKPALVY